MADDEHPAGSPKAEKKQAAREKMIVGGTLALVVLTYLIYRRSQTKQTAAQGYPLGYGAAGGGGGGDSGGGGAPSLFPSGGGRIDTSSPLFPTPSSPPASGSAPANQTPGPGTGPTQATQPAALVFSDPAWAQLPVMNPQPAALAGVFGATPQADVSVYPTTTPVGSIQAPPGGVFSFGHWNDAHQLVDATYALPGGGFQYVHS